MQDGLEEMGHDLSPMDAVQVLVAGVTGRGCMYGEGRGEGRGHLENPTDRKEGHASHCFSS